VCPIRTPSAATFYPGQWRLPSINEHQSLIDYGFYMPALSNGTGTEQWTEGDVFTGVESEEYWSSTALIYRRMHGWSVAFSFGGISHTEKATLYFVWPVRASQQNRERGALVNGAQKPRVKRHPDQVTEARLLLY